MRVKTEDLQGTYTASYAFGSSSLTLSLDGSFLQRVSVGEKTMTRSGHWSFDTQRRRVVLDDALVPDDEFGKPRPNFELRASMTVDLPVERGMFGRLRLGSDEGSPYLKD